MLNSFALYTSGQSLGGAFSPERWALAGEMVLVGMGMVFAVLAILWAVLTVFKVVFAKGEKKERSAPVVQTEAPASEPEPEIYVAGDEELIAVITAAVAAYRAGEGEEATGGFRVVSFRRANGGKAWNAK